MATLKYQGRISDYTKSAKRQGTFKQMFRHPPADKSGPDSEKYRAVKVDGKPGLMASYPLSDARAMKVLSARGAHIEDETDLHDIMAAATRAVSNRVEPLCVKYGAEVIRGIQVEKAGDEIGIFVPESRFSYLGYFEDVVSAVDGAVKGIFTAWEDELPRALDTLTAASASI